MFSIYQQVSKETARCEQELTGSCCELKQRYSLKQPTFHFEGSGQFAPFTLRSTALMKRIFYPTKEK